MEKLLAIEEIKRLKARYMRSMDEKDWDAVAETWAPDAVFDVRAGGGIEDDDRQDRFTEEGYTVGRDNIIAVMKGIAKTLTSVHFGHMPEIEILSETTARAIWSLEDYCWWSDGVPYNTLHGFGHWRDTYEKIDGRWMIKTSKVTRLRVDVT